MTKKIHPALFDIRRAGPGMKNRDSRSCLLPMQSEDDILISSVTLRALLSFHNVDGNKRPAKAGPLAAAIRQLKEREGFRLSDIKGINKAGEAALEHWYAGYERDCKDWFSYDQSQIKVEELVEEPAEEHKEAAPAGSGNTEVNSRIAFDRFTWNGKSNALEPLYVVLEASEKHGTCRFAKELRNLIIHIETFLRDN